ncbi:uncharacterized protein A1O9_01031 [Exophiala aquamarina CBS 119918]|uniref:Enoyl reductase (ER) domain-containing protein n=1 Tax=Exophiala aquamarina CBS 119918 TaxID=1182545 RepID=A0A072Q553_9EURO|nr:uncharacterized protein A1O9_01031 [Exophiala aquamarina CBS 119918]KEF63055.1 hypothetical protein A1O9_01031 [Exophiala aquamarina CBS 119918]
MGIPQHTAAWVLNSRDGIQHLEYIEHLHLPALEEDQILVKIHAASLNYRDLMIAKGGPRLVVGKKNLVGGSDGSGVVEAVGSSVVTYSVGDHVCTHLACGLSETDVPLFQDICHGLGQNVDGTLCQFAIFRESSLVKIPGNLNFQEAATLTCSGLTAWNALFGLEGKAPKPGDIVLVQGTGGLSIAALQFSLAAGATVIATTRTQEKADKLKSLGAHHVINYQETPDWGAYAKSLTVDGKGAHIVVDVGGASTLSESLKAIRVDGMVAVTGILGASADVPTLLDCRYASCVVRGFFLGSRKQFGDMNKFIERHDIKPILDQRTFDMASVKDAYTYMTEQRHFSKVSIRIC